MDKIKAFFENKITKIVAWVIFFIDMVVLFIGGAGAAEFSKAVEIGLLAIAAIGSIIAFITERAKK